MGGIWRVCDEPETAPYRFQKKILTQRRQGAKDAKRNYMILAVITFALFCVEMGFLN
jgi:hypothetical protein